MRSHSRALIAAALVIGLAAPVMAQQPMRHYLQYVKYSDAAIKAMTDNPTDREAAARNLAEGFGGKLDVIYWTPSDEYDGFIVYEFPDGITATATVALARSTLNFQRKRNYAYSDWEEFEAEMQKVKDVKATTAYTVPAQTK